MGDQIAYVLFGGLTMRTLDGGKKVLEKAHAIMQRKTIALDMPPSV